MPTQQHSAVGSTPGCIRACIARRTACPSRRLTHRTRADAFGGLAGCRRPARCRLPTRVEGERRASTAACPRRRSARLVGLPRSRDADPAWKARQVSRRRCLRRGTVAGLVGGLHRAEHGLFAQRAGRKDRERALEGGARGRRAVKPPLELRRSVERVLARGPRRGGSIERAVDLDRNRRACSSARAARIRRAIRN